MASRLVSFGLAIAGIGLLGGCMGIKEHKGYVLDQELASAIQVGVDNKQSVEKTLGRPSFTGQFDTNDWYYVSRDTKRVPFRSQKVTNQDVVHVRFDAAGNVAAVNTMDETLVAQINPVDDKTPTLGRQRSFFDELFGNIGVLNQGALGQQPPGY
ncbi:MAG TPA: outer membrane protein assembly factor BamE [Sphingomicrobium sp.]|jgi:outer membrane protein assembly factor BamE (lipoprotein component of BamABCDE complex)|nr:outer membrane protein assembly factor BamE [Sphingomicrobium sp.]